MSASSTWSWISSMWMAPPSGLRLTSATTTASVSTVTCSRTRAEAAPWPPLTARNALVIAMVILDGSKPTTDPLRRITLYCAKRGSATTHYRTARLTDDELPGWDGCRGSMGCALAMCMDVSPGISCCLLTGFASDSRIGQAFPRKGASGAGFRGVATVGRRRPSPGAVGSRPGSALGFRSKSKSTISCVQVPA